jgi:hypothetical protein
LMRSGPRDARAHRKGFMPLGRGGRRAAFRPLGHGHITVADPQALRVTAAWLALSLMIGLMN